MITQDRFFTLVKIFWIMNIVMLVQGVIYLIVDIAVFKMQMPIYIFINHLLMCYCGVYICTIKTSLDRQVIIKRLARDKVVDVFMFIYSTFMIVLLVALAASPGLNDLGVKVLIVSIFCFLSSTIHMAYRFYVIKQANQLYQQPLIYSENNQNYHQISHN